MHSLKSAVLFLGLARTSLGWVAVVASTQGLRWITLEPTRTAAHAAALKRFSGGLEVLSLNARSAERDVLKRRVRGWVNQVTQRVEKPSRRESCPLDIEGTAFQQAVWAALQRIPAGTVMSYAQLAVKVGRPRAARAVGNACGANPIPFLIPCHRVVAGDGSLGGFGLGVAVKSLLLAREGVTF